MVVMNNGTKRKMKKKLRSCPMCKPHKMHGADARTLQDRRKDVDTMQQITDLPVDQVIGRLS